MILDVTYRRIIFNTWEQHTGAGRLQELQVVQAAGACTAAVEARTVAGETGETSNSTPGKDWDCHPPGFT